MITSDQLKDVLERVEALHRYLDIDKKKIEYEEEQEELFSQYKQDLKSIAAGQGLWLSSKALAVVLVVFELLLVVVGVVVFNWTKAKFTRWAEFQGLLIESILMHAKPEHKPLILKAQEISPFECVSLFILSKSSR